jgi:type I restriction enzyme S subunit
MNTHNLPILAKAFRGELVVQDPKGEPASVLLERIQAEQAVLEAKPKKGKTSRKSRSGKPSKNIFCPLLYPLFL